MELNEAMQRIVRAHWYVIVLCVVAGIVIASAIQPGGSGYAASTRVALGTTTPQTEAEAAAIASTARAIVTGRSRVRDALGAAQLRRNATTVAENDVTVGQLGTSNVVEVTVTDRDPKAAAALANALGSELEQTWLAIGHGQTSQTVADLNARLAALSTQIGTLDAQINATVDPPVKGTDPVRTLLARRDDLSRQATALEAERDRLVSSDAQDVQASVVDSASVPGDAQPTDNAIRIALGALAGLIVGLGLAALIEAVRPSVLGSRRVAETLGTALLGRLPRLPIDESDQVPGAPDVATRINLAAAAGRVGSVELMAVPPTELGPLRDLIARTRNGEDGSGMRNGNANGNGRVPAKNASTGGTRPRPNQPELHILDGTARGARSPAVVVVAPSRTKRNDLGSVHDLTRVTGWSLLGVVTYDPTGLGTRVVRKTAPTRASMARSARQSVHKTQEAARRVAQGLAGSRRP